MTVQEIFSLNLRNELDRAQYTQEEFCDRMNAKYEPKIKRSSVSYWVTGKQMPRPQVIQNIGEFFGHDAGYMLTDNFTLSARQKAISRVLKENNITSSVPPAPKEAPKGFDSALLGLNAQQRYTASRLSGLDDESLKLLNAVIDWLHENGKKEEK